MLGVTTNQHKALPLYGVKMQNKFSTFNLSII